MLRRLLAMATKEFRQLRRDRLTFGMIIGVPVLQILLFGYAIDFDVRQLDAAVADEASTTASRQLVAAAEASQVIRIRRHVDGPEALEDLLESGAIEVGLHVPDDFERRLLDRDRPLAQLLINGSDPTIEGIARQLARMPAPGEAASRPAFEARTFYNPERRSPVHIVPGLIGAILHLTMVLFTAIAIVRERERGNLELLIATPVRSSELMLGKISPYVLIGLVQVTLILAVSHWLFRVPIRGSLVDLYAAGALFVLAALALGLTVSTLARTQFQAMQLTVLTFLPSMLLSGFMFPFDGMPQLAQWIGEAIPLTQFVRISRGILLRGADLSEFGYEVLVLGVFFLVFLAIAIARFRKRLD
jgi:ABC-2 type transport system permease protein